MRRPIVVALLLLAGCASSAPSEEPAAAAAAAAAARASVELEPTIAVPTATVLSVAEPTPAIAPTATAELTAQPVAESTPVPGRPSASTGADGGGAWIGRGTMSDDSVELFWAAPEGVDTHAVYRFLRNDVADPDTAELSDEYLLYRGPETAHLDDTVRIGEQYWYVLFVESADGSTQQRWAIADAVTDTEPPGAVTGLVASRVGDTIELRWDQSSDNYRFARYAIRRSVDGADSIYYGTGFTIDQTSFVDDQLPSSGGAVTYELIAVDFHDNLAEPTLVTVKLG